MDLVTESSAFESGEKRTGVVLIHGLTGTPVEMRPLEKYLKKLGFDVENVLLAGHGAGHKEMLASCWPQWLESARNGVAKILSRNDSAIVCGLSMGAALASCVAAEDSRVSAIVMMSPTLETDGSISLSNPIDSIYQSPLARKFVRVMVSAVPLTGRTFFWQESPPYGIRDERIQKQITKSIEAAKKGGGNEFGVFRTYYHSFVEMWRLIDYARDCLSRVKCPVLVMHSLEDTLASIHNATEAYLSLASSNKALFFLTGCDHVMTLDLQRHLVHETIGRFVQNFSSIGGEHKNVRSVVAPALSEARIAGGGKISAIISPEMHGLDREEWKALYPGRRFAHLASVSDVQQLHSIVLRDLSNPVMSLPVFRGEYAQFRLYRQSSLFKNLLASMSAFTNSNVLGVGSLIQELPGLGLNQNASEESRSRAFSHLINIVDSLAHSAGADALKNVQHQIPALPEPDLLLRATDGQPLKVKESVRRLLAGKESLCYRSPVRAFLSNLVPVAVPQVSPEPEALRLDEVAASAG